MSAENIRKIKIKLKEDYNFIKNDGNILTNIAKDLLTENDNDYQKTFDFMDTLTKRDIQNRMQKIMNELETAGEISTMMREYVRENIKNETDKLEKMKKTIETLEKKNNELEEIVSSLEDEINDLETDKEDLEKTFDTQTNKLKTDKEDLEKTFDTQTNKLKTEVDVLITTKDSLHAELTEIKDSINGVFRKGIYNDEFEYTECDYIVKEPIIHLNVDKALTKIHNIIKDEIILDISYEEEYEKDKSNYFPYGFTQVSYKQQYKHLNFPINIKFENDEEYIIKVYLINSKEKTTNLNYYNQFIKTYFIMYLTNYGRFFKSNSIYFVFKNDPKNLRFYKIFANSIINIENLQLFDYSFMIRDNSTIRDNQKYEPILRKCKINIEEPINLPKFTYRMPRIFLDVIDAFHTQNNDLMQECCKKYLSITRTKGTDEQIIDNIEFNRIIKDKETIIIQKDNVIETMNKRIEEQNSEIEKMKLEIAKLKSVLTVFTS
jgi:predicted  nucleic acid-binding Zn-ribbon protein